ncbi:hypothetical protein [Victivallis vadensis]|uniref:hypothetical protein n=1 Tax=Victivallis vadensis TaxID=172901 RepID=UPI0026DBE004|nr:hypothetical protein [Victivallis vadensis]
MFFHVKRYTPAFSDLRLFPCRYEAAGLPYSFICGTEQVWRWLKPRVCGLPKAINGGCKEIVSRIRKVVGAWIFGKLAVVPQIGVGIWQDLLFNYL